MSTDPSRRQMMMLAALAALPESVFAQDAARVQPDSYRVALDNPQVRVLDYVARPGMGVCGTGLHSHPPHLTVALTNQKVRDRQANGSVIVGELAAGDVFWSEAVTHETENLAGTNCRSLIVEFKRG